jgi:hypothetical protein
MVRSNHTVGCLLFALAFGISLIVPSQAHAEPPTIALVGPRGNLEIQIRAELTALGFQVVFLERPTAPDAPGAVEQAAREANTVAAVSVVPAALGVLVWLSDRVTGKTSVRHVAQTEGAAEQDRFVAVRVVELLRASLLELQLPDPPRGEVAATPELLTAVTPEPPWSGQTPVVVAPSGPEAVAVPPQHRAGAGALLVNAGVGASSSHPSVALTPVLSLGAFWQPQARVSVGLSGQLPLASTQLSEAEGSADLWPWVLVASARLQPFTIRGPLDFSVAAGLMVMDFELKGTRATAPLQITREQLLTAGPHTDLALGWRLSPRLSLRSSLGADYALAKPVVRFAGRNVLALGQPLITLALGLEFRATGTSPGD